MTITTHYYLAPAHWACAAVYGDDDGLERADARAARRWLASLPGDVVDVIGEGAYYERYEPGDDMSEPPPGWPDDAETPGYHDVHDASSVYPYGAECAVYVVHEHTRETYDALAAEYQTYLRAHGLPDEDAESLILDDAIRARHGAYLSRFIERWEAVTA